MGDYFEYKADGEDANFAQLGFDIVSASEAKLGKDRDDGEDPGDTSSEDWDNVLTTRFGRRASKVLALAWAHLFRAGPGESKPLLSFSLGSRKAVRSFGTSFFFTPRCKDGLQCGYQLMHSEHECERGTKELSFEVVGWPVGGCIAHADNLGYRV